MQKKTPRIKIENFGPIKDSGWIDIGKVTVFMGNQGSGKSTIAKLISTFMWLEKKLVLTQITDKELDISDKYRYSIEYHGIASYMRKESSIEYIGSAYNIICSGDMQYGSCGFHEIDGIEKYSSPKIIYIPFERNLTSYMKMAALKELKLINENLRDFLVEFDAAKQKLTTVKLPINNVELEYDKFKELLYIKGNDYKIKLDESASGFQSSVPLFLVTDFLANYIKNNKETKMNLDEQNKFKEDFLAIQNNKDLTEEQKNLAVSALGNKFKRTAFVNIVEEPEQNLFPSSQWELLKKLLECNNMSEGNKLIITTHSPYMINSLTLAVQGKYLESKILTDKKALKALDKLYDIIPKESLVDVSSVLIYEICKNGNVKELDKTSGVPSDSNYLNNYLAYSNESFDKLLEIEQEYEHDHKFL